MEYTIYMKHIVTEQGGWTFRWFWHHPEREGRHDNPAGYTTRRSCEVNATRHGYVPEEQIRSAESGSSVTRAQRKAAERTSRLTRFWLTSCVVLGVVTVAIAGLQA